ncbi:pyridoxamine 5'-phosphate oxidase family protein [Candidatus Izimaplasma bacterium]|nr:pyridoxamine 5'-phosphate oxidase family protein [Candidatus Izimaplasma bacterium]
MNIEYNSAIAVLDELFGKDMTLAFATIDGDKPDVRFVDTYFHNDSFYIVAYSMTNKAKQIAGNKNVSLCYRLHRFEGECFNIGHPLKVENKGIREKLVNAFAPWYFEHNNEGDERMCYLQVKLTKGFTYLNEVGYKIDFNKNEAIESTFKMEIIPNP